MKCLFSNKAEMRTDKGTWEAGYLEIYSDHLCFKGKTTYNRTFSINALSAAIESYAHKVLFLTLPANCLHLFDGVHVDVVFYIKPETSAQDFLRTLRIEKSTTTISITPPVISEHLENASVSTSSIPVDSLQENSIDSASDFIEKYEQDDQAFTSGDLLIEDSGDSLQDADIEPDAGDEIVDSLFQSLEKQVDISNALLEVDLPAQANNEQIEKSDSSSQVSEFYADNSPTEIAIEKQEENIPVNKSPTDIMPDSNEVQIEKKNASEPKTPVRSENTSFKGNYLRACALFSDFVNEHIPEKREKREDAHSEKARSFIFDIINCRYTNLDNAGSRNMPMYMIPSQPSGRLVRCNPAGIYADACVSAYELFVPNPRDAQNEILKKAISDSTSNSVIKTGSIEPMCLMPDVVDDFSRGLRSQLICHNGQRLFQVPRSIATAYSMYLLNTDDSPEEFVVLDYDGEELSATKIRKATTKQGDLVFVRMGRFPIEGSHWSYRTIATEYLNRYSAKNGVSFTEKMMHDLIDTKALQHLLLSDGSRPLLLVDHSSMVALWSDQSIVEEIHQIIADDITDIANQYGIYAYALCSFGYGSISYVMNSDILDTGCQELIERAAMNKPLWEEYLPELKLSVHKDGKFSELILIGENDRRQEICVSYLGKPQEFVVSDGIITLAKGKEYYDLPLEREVYGNMNKEKLARFVPEEPLADDQEVQLKIFYTYGDVDSYKLVAFTQQGTAIESAWCDLNVLENHAPKYLPAELPSLNEVECTSVVTGFQAFAGRVTAPSAFIDDTLYCYKRNNQQVYSRYLRELNAAGFPFRQVRQFFSPDNQTSKVKMQIQEMLKAGVFDCVAGVVEGDLPRNHKLDPGTSNSYPERDQKDVLRENMVKMLPEFGILYTIRHKSVENIINSIRNRKSVQVWAPITAYITRNNDYYGVWNHFSKSLYNMDPSVPKRTVYDLRAISNVCFLTKDWIHEFYHSNTGDQDVDWLLQNIQSYLFCEEWNNGQVYNARKVRDILELLLCVCLLKEENPLILDCNAPETRQLVKQLKKIDDDMRSLDERGLIDQYGKFNCRIQDVDRPDEYFRVNKVIYALVTTLTGGSVNLVGFRSDS